MEAPKLGKHPAQEHARKVAKELGATSGLIYLPGQESKNYEDSDQPPEFRQRRYFYYLSGADFADCAVTYDLARDNLILWIPYTDPRQALWFGKTPTPEECKAQTSVSDVRYITDLPRYLRSYLSTRSPSSTSNTATIYILHPSQPPPLPESLGARGILQIDTVSLQPAMDTARVTKSAWEIAAIRRANAVSSAAHRAVLTRFKKMTNEREIEAVFRGYCLAVGAKKTAYPTIAGSGPNAATLHYGANDEPLAGRQLVVLDAGAEWSCYASDVTRTFPIGGKFTKEAQAIYSIVEKMQESCIRSIRPGYQFVWLHVHAMTVAVSELLKLRILKGAAKDILAAGTGAAFFPHGLGHHVGLEVHDVMGKEKLMIGAGVRVKARGGGLGKREMVSPEMMAGLYRAAVGGDLSKSKAKLEPGMIVTIEPGIYFSRAYIEAFFLKHPVHSKFIDGEVLEKYYDVGGVRIEDDILVTEDGNENLTPAPKGEEAVRIINGEDKEDWVKY